MGRYIYKPVSYTDWMNRYIDTLKSGEMLVDFDNGFDVYVTENGINIPIPVTKGLRDKVISFINKDLNTLTLKESQIDENLSTTAGLYDKIRMAQINQYGQLQLMDSQVREIKARNVSVSTINQNTINQLGDLIVNTAKFPVQNMSAELHYYINLWNKINVDHGFDGFIKDYSQELVSMYKDIVNLTQWVNEALDGFPTGKAHTEFHQNNSKDVKVYDVNYSNYMNNLNFSTDVRAWLKGNVRGPLTYTGTGSNFDGWYNPNQLYRGNVTAMITPGMGIIYPWFPLKRSVGDAPKQAVNINGINMYNVDNRYNLQAAGKERDLDMAGGTPLNLGSRDNGRSTINYFNASQFDINMSSFNSSGYWVKTPRMRAPSASHRIPGTNKYYTFSNRSESIIGGYVDYSGSQPQKKFTSAYMGRDKLPPRWVNRGGLSYNRPWPSSEYLGSSGGGAGVLNIFRGEIRQGVSKTIRQTDLTDFVANGIVDKNGNVTGMRVTDSHRISKPSKNPFDDPA